MKPFSLIALLLLVSWQIVIGQENKTDQKYSRVSLTVVYIDDPNPDPNGGLSSDIRTFMEKTPLVGAKFDDHAIESRFVTIDIPNYIFENHPIGKSDLQPINQFLATSDVPRQIVAKWFNRKPDGSFSMDLIGQRGLYNANDNDYLTAVASQRQTGGLKDQGEKLLKRSYLLLVNFSDIQSKADKSNPGKLNFGGTGRGFLYQLDWTDSVSTNFYTQLWISENDPAQTKETRKKAFDETVFPMKFIREAVFSIAPSTIFLTDDKRTDGEKKQALFANLYEQIQMNMENHVSDFQVRQNLVSSKPIGATIGKKEGVYVDQRFFVYENVQKKNQEVMKKRRAVVRALKVSDNEKITEGKTTPTTFYQVAGKKVDHFGMYLEQKNDHGLALTGTYLLGEIGAANLTIAYNLSRLLGKSMNVPAGIYVFVDGDWDKQSYAQVNIPNYYTSSLSKDYTFLRFSVGFSKDFYFARHFHLAPRIGYGIETTDVLAKNEQTAYPDGLSVNGDHVVAGLTLGMNLVHNIQLIGGANYYFLLNDNYVKAGSAAQVAVPVKWDQLFTNRAGLSPFFGLRLLW